MLGIILDVAIGLVFTYVLLSLICSGIVECISAICKWRAKNLQNVIENILGKDYADKFWKQHLIKSLSPPSPKGRFYIWVKNLKHKILTKLKLSSEKSSDSSKKPSYIPVENFVAAIESMILSGYFDKDNKNNFKEVLKVLIDSKERHRSNISLETKKTEETKERKKTKDTEEEKDKTAKEFENTIAYLLYKSSDIKEFRDELGKWYENVRHRAQGWYKRKVFIWLFIVGFVLAILGNIDTMQIAKTLYADSILRKSIVEQATEFWKQYSSQQNENSTDPENKKMPDSTQNTKGKQDFVNTLDSHLKILPIGWHGELSLDNIIINLKNLKNTKILEILKNPKIFEILKKILGWLITAVAVSFGAPFWFDLLGKLVNLRATGRKPEGLRK